jgi:hypothetical protein
MVATTHCDSILFPLPQKHPPLLDLAILPSQALNFILHRSCCGCHGIHAPGRPSAFRLALSLTIGCPGRLHEGPAVDPLYPLQRSDRDAVLTNPAPPNLWSVDVTSAGRFLEVFRVIQVRQHRHGRAHKTAYSIVFPSIILCWVQRSTLRNITGTHKENQWWSLENTIGQAASVGYLSALGQRSLTSAK